MKSTIKNTKQGCWRDGSVAKIALPKGLDLALGTHLAAHNHL